MEHGPEVKDAFVSLFAVQSVTLALGGCHPNCRVEQSGECYKSLTMGKSEQQN